MFQADDGTTWLHWAESGVTSRMCEVLAQIYGFTLNVIWNGSKILCYTPARPRKDVTSVTYEIKGDHAFFMACTKTKDNLAHRTELVLSYSLKFKL